MNDRLLLFVKPHFFHIKNIARIKKYLSEDSIKTLVHAFVTCKLDHCNSLLYGLPKYFIEKVQLVQNCAARFVVGRHKYEHITPVPVEDRIVFKMLLLTYKALNNQAPFYIRDMLDIYIPARKLRSSSKCLLEVPIS